MNYPAFDIMGFIQYDSLPLELVYSGFAHVEALRELMRNCAIGSYDNVVMIELIHVFFPLLGVVDESLSIAGVLF